MKYSRIIVALVIGLVFMQLPLPAAHASYTVRNRIITNPATSGRLLPWGSGRMASFGELSAFLYRTESSGDWLYLYDGFGNESHIPLPELFDLNDRANAEYVLTSPTDLWIWSGVLGRAALRHYRFSRFGASRLPNRAVLVSITSVGDNDTRPGGLLKLASGGVVGVWHQYRQYPDQRLEVGVIYVSPKGGAPLRSMFHVPGMEGTPVAARWALVQHPADGSIWAFLKRDSYHEISALHFTEEEGGVRLNWIKPDFINKKDGVHEPEGEYPYLTSAADLRRKTIVLAYQNSNYDIMYVTDGEGIMTNGSCRQDVLRLMEPSFFAKRSSVSFATIGVGGRKIFQALPGFVERTQEFGLSVTDRLWFLYRRIDCDTSGYVMLQRQGEVRLRYHDGEWSEPLIIGSLDPVKDYYAASLFFSSSQPHFLMRLDDGLLHLFEAKPNP